MLYTGIKKLTDEAMRLRTLERLIKLREQLDNDIPEKTAESSLLLATWNIRAFGKDGRTQESLYYIAEILSRFDLIAIQEVKGQREGLEKVMALMGKNWSYIATDVNTAEGGNGECIAFLYDTNKVSFKNMAGEIVLPNTQTFVNPAVEKKKEEAEKKGVEYVESTDEKQRVQFARTPFCVSFQAGWFKFNIATVHIYYGTDSKEIDRQRREDEIRTIAEFLSKRADDEKNNYIILGDFNIPKAGDRYMKALESGGFHIPEPLKKHPSNLGETKHYDQIAFNLQLSDDKKMVLFDENVQHSGAFNWSKSVYRTIDYADYMPLMDKKYREDEEKAKKYFKDSYRTNQMSDHLPLWVELKVDFSDQYLKGLKANYEKGEKIAKKAAAKKK